MKNEETAQVLKELESTATRYQADGGAWFMVVPEAVYERVKEALGPRPDVATSGTPMELAILADKQALLGQPEG